MISDISNFLQNSSGIYLYMVVRIVLGTLFFFQAYDKIVRVKLKNEIAEVAPGSYQKGIPVIISKISVYATSYVELIGGFLLIIGLFTPFILYIFGLHIILLVFAFSYLQGLWDMKYVLPRMALLFLLFLLPPSWNIVSIDHLFTCFIK